MNKVELLEESNRRMAVAFERVRKRNRKSLSQIALALSMSPFEVRAIELYSSRVPLNLLNSVSRQYGPGIFAEIDPIFREFMLKAESYRANRNWLQRLTDVLAVKTTKLRIRISRFQNDDAP